MGRKKLTAGRDPNSPLICCICDDIARGHNFSVMSCVSCKSFFRRHGSLKVDQCQCRYNGDCQITKISRADCLACRLRKCLEVGMDPLMIRVPAKPPTKSTINRQAIVVHQNQIQLPTPQPLSLLRNDRSNLTSEQWTLLSNIICSYDEQNIIGRVKSILDEKSSLPPKLRLKPEEIFHLFSTAFMGLQPLIERSSHFNALSPQARRTLMLRNVFFTGSVNGCLVARETNAFSNTAFLTISTALYGSDHLTKSARDNERLEKNGSLVKLLLFVLIFSSNCSIVMFNADENSETMSNSIELIRIQDIYATMLWKYLAYLYGYDGAVMRFSLLMQSLMTLYSRTEDALKTLSYTRFADDVVTQTEQVLHIVD